MTETQDNRERVLAAAADLFRRFGFRSISMDDIARQLGMSKRTLYQHFSDKDEIVTLAIGKFLQRKKELLKNIADEARDAVELLIKVNHFLLTDITETSGSLMFELRKYHLKAWEVVQEFKSDFIFSIVHDNLKNGIEQGYFRNDIDVEVLSRLRMEEVALPLNDEVFPKGNFDMSHVSMTILDHFANAITTDRGRKLYLKHMNQLYKHLTTTNH